jgi:hypothetical protein
LIARDTRASFEVLKSIRVAEILFGINAEGKSPKDVTKPLTSTDDLPPEAGQSRAQHEEDTWTPMT